MKKIFITGASGFIGRALKQRLLTNGYSILEMNSNHDITVSTSFNCFKSEHIDHIFHLAAKTFVPDSWRHPQSFYQTNVLGTVNVLDFCRGKSVPLTFASSYLYGQPEKLPISEDHQIKPNNPYAHSKYLSEQICQFYAKEFGVKTTIIRPFNVYGIGQSDKYLIPYIIKQALHNVDIKVENLLPKRDYIYLDDLVDFFVLSMIASKQFAIYNIGSGYSLSVKDVICVVQEILGINKKIVSDNRIRKNEIYDVVADISNANSDIGWSPKHSFYQGVEKIVEYEKRKLHAEATYTYQ